MAYNNLVVDAELERILLLLSAMPSRPLGMSPSARDSITALVKSMTPYADRLDRFAKDCHREAVEVTELLAGPIKIVKGPEVSARYAREYNESKLASWQMLMNTFLGVDGNFGLKKMFLKAFDPENSVRPVNLEPDIANLLLDFARSGYQERHHKFLDLYIGLASAQERLSERTSLRLNLARFEALWFLGRDKPHLKSELVTLRTQRDGAAHKTALDEALLGGDGEAKLFDAIMDEISDFRRSSTFSVGTQHVGKLPYAPGVARRR